jgi:hypothetical protein
MAKARPPKDPVDRFRTALDKGGLAGIEKAIQRVGKQAEVAQKPFEKLAETLADPRIRRAAGEALAVEDATRKLNAQARERLSIESRRQSVINGAYGQELRANQLIAKERERVEALERRAQFGSRYGRLGGLMYHADALRNSALGRHGMAVATGIGGAAATAGMQGLQGTVEWNRLQLEINLMSKEIAGAFLPAIRFATRAAEQMRRAMEGFSIRQQHLLLLGGLAFSGLAMAGLARMGLAGLAGGLGGAGAGAAGAAGGMLARVGAVGAAGAGAAALGIVTNNPLVGAAGGAALGFSRAGPLGALVGGVSAAAMSAPAEREGERPSEYLARMYRRSEDGGDDRSMLGALLATGGRSIAKVFGAEPERPGGRGPNPDRDRATLAQAGFEAPGSAFQRMTTTLALVDATRAGADRPITVENMLKDIYDFMKETFTNRPAMR